MFSIHMLGEVGDWHRGSEKKRGIAEQLYEPSGSSAACPSGKNAQASYGSAITSVAEAGVRPRCTGFIHQRLRDGAKILIGHKF